MTITTFLAILGFAALGAAVFLLWGTYWLIRASDRAALAKHAWRHAGHMQRRHDQ